MLLARRALAALLIALGLGVGGAAVAGAQTPPAEQPGQLYVLQADGGTLARAPGGGLRLTLTDPFRTVTSFTDRPARVGASTKLRRFVASWPKSFAGDPPNAALQIDGAPAGRDVALLELGRPRLDTSGRSLVFPVKRLTATRQRQLGSIARRADARVAPAFGRASLFIDDGPADSYPVTITLTPGAGATSTAEFTLFLGNTSFGATATVGSTVGVGRTTTPSLVTQLAPLGVSISMPAGAAATAQLTVTPPTNGVRVQGVVTVPTGYTATVTTGVGSVQITQSGPVTFPRLF